MKNVRIETHICILNDICHNEKILKILKKDIDDLSFKIDYDEFNFYNIIITGRFNNELSKLMNNLSDLRINDIGFFYDEDIIVYYLINKEQEYEDYSWITRDVIDYAKKNNIKYMSKDIALNIINEENK
jgi:hypothetical protein